MEPGWRRCQKGYQVLSTAGKTKRGEFSLAVIISGTRGISHKAWAVGLWRSASTATACGLSYCSWIFPMQWIWSHLFVSISEKLNMKFTLNNTLEIQSYHESTIWICSVSQRAIYSPPIPLAQNINLSHQCIWYRRVKSVADRIRQESYLLVSSTGLIHHPLYSSDWS